jgi:hypothetical protein
MKASVRRIFLLIFSIFLIKIPHFVIAQPAERTPSIDPHHYLPGKKIFFEMVHLLE